MNDIKNNIINKIKAGEVQMVPRWQFVLKALLLGLSVIIVALLAIYFLSFILFALHETGVWFAPGFGMAGIMLFVTASPWILILTVAIFLLVLYFLVSKYSFSYRKPLVYSMIGVVLAVVGISSFIQFSMLHERVHEFVERHEIPGLTPLYRGLEKTRPGGLVVGVITEIDNDELSIETEMGEIEVQVSERTKLPRNTELTVGLTVMVFGDLHGDDIEAFGIRIDDGTLPPRYGDFDGKGDRPPRDEMMGEIGTSTADFMPPPGVFPERVE